MNNHNFYGFSDVNVSAYRIFTDRNLSIIILSNGYKYYAVQEQLINHIAALVDKNLIDEYLLTEESIISELLKIDNQNVEYKYQIIKNKNSHWNLKKLNSIGYTLIRNNRLNDAIKIFKLNVKENPNSSDAFDSLGEGYFIAGKYEVSKKHYLKSLELNPQNDNTKEMHLKINQLLSSKK